MCVPLSTVSAFVPARDGVWSHLSMVWCRVIVESSRDIEPGGVHMKTNLMARISAGGVGVLVGVGALLVGPATLARADTQSYPVAYTGGIGAYPRSAPVYDARVGVAQPEGYLVPARCWTYGESVPPNSLRYTSNIWIQHDGDGTYWPEAWLATGSDGIPAGLPNCSDADQTQVDEAPASIPNGFYNRTRAVEWALAHAPHDPAGSYFASTCTWFVSQALWEGGFPKDATWTDQGTHGGRRLPGTVAAWSVQDLKAYLESHYDVTVTDLSANFTSNAVPEAEAGDLIVYDWGEGEGWSHFTMVTNIAPGQYPEVSEWGVNASYVKRGWTYSDNSGTWLQTVHPQVRAELIHINGGLFVPDF